MKLRNGFTLIEMIVFVGIFSVVIAAFTMVFTNVLNLQVRQSSQADVQSQSQFLLQTVQYYVERSSLVDMTTDVGTSTLRLRMSSSTEDPVIMSLVNGVVKLQIGAGTPQAITSSRVSVSNLSFTARVNPGARTSVAVAFTVDYATNNLTQKFAQSLQTSIARATVANFDSNIVPTVGNTYHLGAAAGDWRSINNTLFFSGSNVGIGTSPAASTPLEVSGGDIYVASSTAGIILKNGSNCYRLNVTSAGIPTTTAVSPCP